MSKIFNSRTITYTDRIESVTFGITGSDEAVINSSVAIVSSESTKNGKPYDGGVTDLRLGTNDHSYECKTCFNGKELCLGHAGYIKLNYPVYSPLFLLELRKWLRLICFKCGKAVIDREEYIKFPKTKRLSEASKIAKTVSRKCMHCNEPHPILKKEKKDIIVILAEYRSDAKDKQIIKTERLFPHHIKPILERVSFETVVDLGKEVICHPSKFVLDNIVVPPITIRPDDKSGGSKRPQNNHLTTMLKQLIKINEKIPTNFEYTGTLSENLESLFVDLNIMYYKLVKGGTAQAGKVNVRTGQGQLNSIAMRLKGKQGRFRKTQMGKRVHLCARSTIINNPRLKVDEIGLPISFARTLQIEETVQDFNREQSLVYFQNGRTRYPGCTKIFQKKTNTFRSVENSNGNNVLQLEIGDKIYRDLIDGDYVLFNRQPSLWPVVLEHLE